jgi:hypothetical protein
VNSRNVKDLIRRRTEIDKARRVIQADNNRLYAEWWSAQKRAGRTDEELRAIISEAMKHPSKSRGARSFRDRNAPRQNHQKLTVKAVLIAP